MRPRLVANKNSLLLTNCTRDAAWDQARAGYAAALEFLPGWKAESVSPVFPPLDWNLAERVIVRIALCLSAYSR